MRMDWIVIGAGPAGIAAVGKLLDHGVQKIGWIDPDFRVGDLGQKWACVPGNTKVKLFSRFLEDCKAFENQKRPRSKFDSYGPEEYCLLGDVVEPLQWVTDHLKSKVHPIPGMAMALRLSNGEWEVKLKKRSVFGKKVMLAVGSDPKMLPLTGADVIPLETALHPEKLKGVVGPKSTVGVFGSSHSAFLTLANLIDLGVKAINFYRSPHRYAIHQKDWILFDSTGLKGFTAEWALKNIDGVLPSLLTRVPIFDPTFEESLALCTEVVYATGFSRRKLPVLEQYQGHPYDEQTGLIAPGLYGIGIAFPQAKFDRLGHLEYLVGLWKFMDYLNIILPFWI